MPSPCDLLVLCPTMRRPANVARLKQSYYQTATGVSELRLLPGDAGLVTKLNQAAVPAARQFQAVMYVGDDHVFETPGWDKLLMDPLRDRPGFSYPDDVTGYGKPEIFAMSSALIRALGWMALPALNHYYIDDVVMELGARAGCLHFLPEVQVPHLHYRVTGGVRDAAAAKAEARLDDDREAYWLWLREQSDIDVHTVHHLVSAYG